MSVQLLATSTTGLEAVVSRELTALGYENRIVGLGRIAFVADELAICRANIWLRAAGRVLLELGRFEATDFGELFDRTYALPWDQWIGPDGSFPVNGRSLKSQLSSVPACQRIVKKAVAEKLMAAHGVSTLAETGATYPIEISLANNEATLTIDTSGSGLHKRGYRPLRGQAPLRETLAAGLVLLSFWKPGRPLVDPFCGTGTIPIEAALIGRNLAPGRERTFAAQAWPAIGASHWAAAREEAGDLAGPALSEPIVATDIDREAIGHARYHAELAGVAEDIHFQVRDFSDLLSRRPYGCLITNPPYAEQMGDADEVAALYQSMPNVLRRLKTWSHFILTAYPDFETLLGQQADRRRKLYNSRIECTYYQFHGPRKPRTSHEVETLADAPGEPPSVTAASAANPPVQPAGRGPIAVAQRQAFGGLSAKAAQQAEVFGNCLARRARHLRRWPTRQGITCYRLYDRDVPEVPLVVDRYEDCLHLSEYERPHDRTPAEHADWLDLMLRTAGRTLEVPPRNVFLKRRQRQRGNRQHSRYADQQRTMVVSEGGLKFQVNLSDYVDTGLFLDHRNTRAMVRDASAGRRALNLFGYTGAFTVYAAAGGAASTVTVDLSNTYVQWARANLALNDLAGPAHRLFPSDAMQYLTALPGGPHFDLAVVDPPTFSNSKKTDTAWDIQRDHVALLNTLLARMAPEGLVFFSTNFRRFKFAAEALIGASNIREISRQTVPADFRNQRVHRCWRIVCEGVHA